MNTLIGRRKIDNKEFILYKSLHTNVKRGSANVVRDAFLDNSQYLKVFEYSLKQGLTSFGIYTKENIVITFKDSWNLNYSILVERNNNEFIVKTVFNSKKIPWWKHFKKIHNRINLNHYMILEVMSKEEYFKNIKESKKLHVEVLSMKEDHIFERFVGKSGITKLK